MSNTPFNLINPPFEKEANHEPVIGTELAEAYNQSRNGSGHQCFCYAPSANMYFSQDGSVHVCCHNMEYSLGKYPEQTIREIWNSAKTNELRQHMRNYDLSHGCRICESDVRMCSFNEVPARHFDHIPKHPEYPTMMEFLISNTCNLECVMCKGEYSSLIRKNREHLPPLRTPYDKEFLNQLEEFIPFLHEARFSGSGEAFSIDMNYEIWGKLIRKNPKCVIMVQTNGTILTARVKDILSRGNFQIGVSLDGMTKATYEGIRVNANFDKVMENVRYFADYCREKKIKFSLAMCAMRQNWRELPDFINFCNSMNAVAIIHKVWNPLEYALHKLPKEGLYEVYDYLATFDFKADTERQNLNRSHYRYFVSVVKTWAEKVAEISHIKSMHNGELFLYLKEKLKNGYSAKPGTSEEKKAILEDSMNKMQAVLNHFNSNQRENLLRWACAKKSDIVSQPLEKYPVDYLVKLAKVTADIELE